MVKVERKLTIQAPVQEVWKLLSSQEGMRLWLEDNIEIDLRVGGKYKLVDKDSNQLITGEVLEIIPNKLISMSWLEDGPDTDWMHPIRFIFTLDESSEGTIVNFVKDGFENIGKATWHKTYEAYERGSDRHNILGKLKEAVESKHVIK